MNYADTSIANVRVGLRFGGRTREVTLKIIGMHCATCSLTVQKALLSVPGVLTANVSLASDEAKVVVDEARIDYKALLRAVQRAGYDVYREEVKVYLRSLNPDDESAITKALSRIGVFNVGFDLTNHSVIIEYNPLDITSDELTTMLRRSGFTVINVSKASEVDLDVDKRTVESDLRDILLRLVVAVPLTTAIFIMMILTMTSLIPIPLYNLLSFILATPVQFYSGWRFIKGAVRAFHNATANMDTLVALGTLSAYVFSILVLINLLPDDKVNIINELRGKYGLIAMVGDGINDAAALNAADVGIAMGSGSDITKEAGDVVLLRNRLDQLIDLITLSRRVLNNIKFNLIYAFLYNVILIPIAAGVVPGITVRPEWAGLAMALSSITVTLNALRLRYSHV
ncbi:MAG: HAD-IC family P-type ATPase [Vulcanisaeta sp.]|uniref:HAD-IC family P-type ATPase n=1 Tax=Vulcanisaeta sp. TaxID=2020871 RepID=UPI003D0CF948